MKTHSTWPYVHEITQEVMDDCIIDVRKSFTESFDGEHIPLQNCRCTIKPVISNGFNVKEYTLRFIAAHQRLEARK